MWGGWVEKAKQAAATLDQQLNESVGVEVPAAKPAPAAGAEKAANVWNDDDFKFDDDDEVEQTTAPLLEEPNEKPIENAWSQEEHETDFDNFDGVSPPQLEDSKPPPASPPASAIAGPKLGGLSLNLGVLAAKVKVPERAGQINFMSPISTLMTSINHDQEQQHNDEEETSNKVPATPLKNEKTLEEATKREEPAPKPEEEDADKALDEDAENGAWQEEDIGLDEAENVELLEEKHEPETKEQEPKMEDTVEPPAQIAEEEPPAQTAEEEEKKLEKKVKEPKQEKIPESKEGEQTNETAPPPTPEIPPAKKGAPDIQEPQPVEVVEKTPPEAESSKAPTANEIPAGPIPTTAESTVSNAELEKIKTLLAQREEQLAAKAEQMFELQQMYDKEKQDLIKKLNDTKEEAKKRILKARERCEAAETKLQSATSALTEDAAQQAQVVAALREEGQKLAKKQAEMEKAVRNAKGEARELKEQLEDETASKLDALAKIEKLQAELKATQEQLSSARKGETQAGKLDAELQAAKEDIANKENTIMSLQQTVKELTAEKKELLIEVEASRQGAAEESLQEQKKLRREHNAAIADLEAKLATSEREAAVREDQLRHEVEELRKRWQDAVRRADALSMDVQSSTGPLLRQLESMERQHRARASAAAELETRLRAELEETVIKNEKLTKEHSELKIKHGRLERQAKEQQSDLDEKRKTIDELTTKANRLEQKLQDLQIEGEKRREDYEKVERLANEGVSKVRSEMSQAVLESEERYRSQLETMKEELRIERDKRAQLEKQVDELLENAAVIVPNPSNEFMAKESKPAKLKKSEGQAQILEGALKGLGGDSDDDDNYTDDEDLDVPQSTGGSFAALEQLTSNLKAAKKELETLRKRLAESEKTRESLMEELGESRDAKEKLPLFESKVKELMADNREKELEIRGLQDDIAEVKEMYRTQLNVLLEEKAAAFAVLAADSKEMNGSSNEPAAEEPEPEPELVEDVLGGML